MPRFPGSPLNDGAGRATLTQKQNLAIDDPPASSFSASKMLRAGHLSVVHWLRHDQKTQFARRLLCQMFQWSCIHMDGHP
eukprot:359219-Chlamydomonas_euryale.AAC.12